VAAAPPLRHLLAAQKNYFTVHLMSAYADKTALAHLQEGFKKAGKKLDMGKACIRFRKLEDLPLAVIGESIGRVPLDNYVRFCQSARKK